MPIVHVELMKGRDPAAIEQMMAGIAQAVSDAVDAPIGTVRVLVREMDEHQYSVGGRPIREVRAARAADAGRAATEDDPGTSTHTAGGTDGASPSGPADAVMSSHS